jgi:hypothetical protein
MTINYNIRACHRHYDLKRLSNTRLDPIELTSRDWSGNVVSLLHFVAPAGNTE